MSRSLGMWPYLATATLALAFGLFLHILDEKLFFDPTPHLPWHPLGKNTESPH
jgi:hypothetical protein